MRDYEPYYHKSYEQIMSDVVLALAERYGEHVEKIFNAATIGRHKNLTIHRLEKDCGVTIKESDLRTLQSIQEAAEAYLKAKALMMRALKHMDGVY